MLYLYNFICVIHSRQKKAGALLVIGVTFYLFQHYMLYLLLCFIHELFILLQFFKGFTLMVGDFANVDAYLLALVGGKVEWCPYQNILGPFSVPGLYLGAKGERCIEETM